MNILVNNTYIIAVNPVDSGDSYTTADQIIPKHVVEGATIVDVVLPENFNLVDWKYENGQLVYHAPVPVVTVPEVVSPRQIRQALNRAGLRQAVESAVANGDQDMKDWWEFATSVERTHPLVIGMAAALGVSEEQLDQLFIIAGTL